MSSTLTQVISVVMKTGSQNKSVFDEVLENGIDWVLLKNITKKKLSPMIYWKEKIMKIQFWSSISVHNQDDFKNIGFDNNDVKSQVR